MKHRCEIHRVREEIKPYQVERSDILPARVADFAAIASSNTCAATCYRLLIDGNETFDAIIAEIATARHCVCVQIYIMREDGPRPPPAGSARPPSRRKR